MAELDYTRAIEILDSAHTICVCGHINPDGDCLGSVMALTLALRAQGHSVTPLLATTDKVAQLDFLEGYDELKPAREYLAVPDVFVAVDVSEKDRLGDAEAIFNRAAKTILIDHHVGPADYADACYVDDTAAAAGILVWAMLKQMGAERTAQIASWCYAALVTDTGRFQFQNADARALRCAAELVESGADPSDICTNIYQRKSLAALKFESRVIERLEFLCEKRAAISWITRADYAELNATKDDSDSLIDVVRQIAGVEVAVMLREEDDYVRGSIRSKTTRNVAEIAAKMNGGGHIAAAGFTVYGTLDEARELVKKHIETSYEQHPAEEA